MKNNIAFFFLMLFLVSRPFFAAAQNGGGGRNMDPVQRAEQQTALMIEKLALSDAQAVKIKETNLKYAAEMKAAREANPDADRDAMREKMQAIRKAQNEELKTMLTDEQWAAWEKVQEEQSAKWGGGREGRKKDAKPENGGGN